MPKRRIIFGVSLKGAGYHPAAWRMEDAPANPDTDVGFYIQLAQTVERGNLDFIFLADAVAIRESDSLGDDMAGISGLSRFEPLTVLSAIATHTRHIGLVATASTTYNEPYHTARLFASLDHISGGRAGWNVVTSATDPEARNFSRDQQMDVDMRYDRAREYVDVVRLLWESWGEDALIGDKALGRYVEPSRIRAIDHVGKYFSVKGPLNISRAPQGRLCIAEAGASEAGQELAAATADMVYSKAETIEGGQKFYQGLKCRMAKYNRTEDCLKVLTPITIYVGRTKEEAEEKYRYLQSLVTPEVGLARLKRYFGDLSAYPLDGPLPANTAAPAAPPSVTALLRARAEKNKLSIRQLYEWVSGGFGASVLIGDANEVADELEQWVDTGACDGFVLTVPNAPGGIKDFVDLVVPVLQERGRVRRAYEDTLFRQNLLGAHCS